MDLSLTKNTVDYNYARPGAVGRDCAAGANAGTLGAVLKRQLSLLVSTMSQWWVRRSSNALDQAPLPGRSRARGLRAHQDNDGMACQGVADDQPSGSAHCTQTRTFMFDLDSLA